MDTKNAELTPLAIYAYFVSHCRENLHIIIAFSPIGSAFRNRLRQYPSLINCCTIDWFQVYIGYLLVLATSRPNTSHMVVLKCLLAAQQYFFAMTNLFSSSAPSNSQSFPPSVFFESSAASQQPQHQQHQQQRPCDILCDKLIAARRPSVMCIVCEKLQD